MDNIMFPLHQGNELCFQISSPNLQDLILPTISIPPPPPTNPHHTFHAPALHGVAASSSSTIPSAAVAAGQTTPRRRKKPASPSPTSTAFMDKKNINIISGGGSSTSTTTTTPVGDGGGHNTKKLMHREIERQRRQEMSTLYSSLRSLLPLQFLKGKRSMSDHMNEAVNYIKQLQRRIQDLEAKKNGLMMINPTTLTNNNTTTTSSSSFIARQNGKPLEGSDSSVEVRRCLGGVEIVVGSPLEGGGGGLSGVLRVLGAEGVSVVNCISTKVSRKCFHTIVAEVEDPTRLNMSALQEKLMMTMMMVPPLILASSSSSG